MVNKGLAARNPVKPSAYFLRSAKLEQGAIRAASRLTAPSILTRLVNRYLQVTYALYSAGDSVSNCLVHVANVSESLLKSFVRSVKDPIKGIPDITIYIEGLSASRLVGMQAKVVKAYRSAKFERIAPWQRSLLDCLSALLVGDADRSIKMTLTGAPMEYGQLFIAVLNSAVRGDPVMFDRCLEDYLIREWGPVADRRARGDLTSTNSMHAGKWTLFAPAICLVLDHVPALSAKALEYFPGELASQLDSGSVWVNQPAADRIARNTASSKSSRTRSVSGGPAKKTNGRRRAARS